VNEWASIAAALTSRNVTTKVGHMIIWYQQTTLQKQSHNFLVHFLSHGLYQELVIILLQTLGYINLLFTTTLSKILNNRLVNACRGTSHEEASIRYTFELSTCKTWSDAWSHTHLCIGGQGPAVVCVPLFYTFHRSVLLYTPSC